MYTGGHISPPVYGIKVYIFSNFPLAYFISLSC